MSKLIDHVEYLFSKNAGPYLITFDVVFSDEREYRHVCDSGVFVPERLADLYGVAADRIVSIHEYDPGRIIKFTLIREHCSGDFGDRSVFGSQQWIPLIDLEIPDAPRAG
jgi:hypothetical protein